MYAKVRPTPVVYQVEDNVRRRRLGGARGVRHQRIRRPLDGGGRELDAARGEVILGHPLNAVMWLAADLKHAGVTLKPGDLLSLGSFSKALPAHAGTTVRVVYEGLPGTPAVSVRFR